MSIVLRSSRDDDAFGGIVRYASFKYDLSTNLGDEIQTLAVEQFLPRVDTRIDRDSLALFQADEKHLVILQGWFSHRPERCFPPSDAILPVFVGFHISGSRTQSYLLSGPRLDYLKAHAPIGCRDEGTRRFLEQAGVPAYTTHCLTLTFPIREQEPKHGKVFIVGAEHLRIIPRSLRRGAVVLDHTCSVSLGDELKRAEAQRLIDRYRDEARLVVTTRLHCALPCIGMGIPVVFLGDPDDYRLGVLLDLGVPIVRRYPKHRLLMKKRLRAMRGLWYLWNRLLIDWNPRPLMLEKEKETLREIVRRELRQAAEAASKEGPEATR